MIVHIPVEPLCWHTAIKAHPISENSETTISQSRGNVFQALFHLSHPGFFYIQIPVNWYLYNKYLMELALTTQLQLKS